MARLAVVGAGIVGLLTGLAAARAGREVLVLEAGEPGAGASTRNAGVLHPLQPPPGRLRRRLAPLGARAWRRLAPELGVEMHEVDLYMPALTIGEQLLLPLVALAVQRLSRGLARTRILSTREAREREPLVTRRARRVLHIKGYAVADPEALVRAAAEALEQEGGEILSHTRVEALQCGHPITLETSRGPVEADLVVNAAGPGAAELAGQAGLKVEVRLVPGVMELFREPQASSMIAGVPGSPRPESKGGAVIPWPWRGATLYGPSFGGDPGPGGVARRYARLLEEEPRGLMERIVGYRTVAKGRDFIIAVPPGCGGSVHLLGIESPGLTAAPVLALRALEALGVGGLLPGV